MAKKLTIALSRPHDEPLQVSGYTTETEGLGVYRSPNGLKLPWSIAHLASGTTIGQYRIKKDAETAATSLGLLGIDWAADIAMARHQVLGVWDEVKEVLSWAGRTSSERRQAAEDKHAEREAA